MQGTVYLEPLPIFDPSDWDSVINSNLKGTYLCAKYALPHLLAQQGGGQIINVLSIAAKVAFPASSAYCAAKAGALALTKVLAAEVRDQNIRVTAVLPGSVETTVFGMIFRSIRTLKRCLNRNMSQTLFCLCVNSRSAWLRKRL